MVDYELSHRSIDSDRMFATGFSAGGFMTTVMLATYPEVFAAATSCARRTRATPVRGRR